MKGMSNFWKILISDPTFIKMHLNRSHKTNLRQTQPMGLVKIGSVKID
jgi:hypothetical protein